MTLRANDLQRLHGAELALPPYSEATTAGQLFNMLEQRRPRVSTTSRAVRTWLDKYRTTPDATRVSSASDLAAVYGEHLRHFIQDISDFSGCAHIRVFNHRSDVFVRSIICKGISNINCRREATRLSSSADNCRRQMRLSWYLMIY